MELFRLCLIGKICASHFHHSLNVIASKPISQKVLGIITNVSDFDEFHIKRLAVNQPNPNSLGLGLRFPFIKLLLDILDQRPTS